MMIGIKAICLLIGYILGSFQTGYFYGRYHHIDVRQKGSGNTGSTNVTRTLGWQAGLITLLGDAGKAVIAIIIVHLIFGKAHPDSIFLLSAYAGLGAVLGHDFPFYMKFKGGKGIATTSGFILSLCVWWMPASLLLAFIIIVAVTRYVSLGSLFVMTGFFIMTVVWGQLGNFPIAAPMTYEFYVITGIMMLLAYYKHKANIGRLAKGKENKFSFHSNN